MAETARAHNARSADERVGGARRRHGKVQEILVLGVLTVVAYVGLVPISTKLAARAVDPTV